MAIARLDSAATNLDAGGTYSISAGSDRLLIVALSYEDTAVRDVSAVTWGGQSLTHIATINNTGGSFRVGIEIWGLLEAGIAAGSGTTIGVTWDTDPSVGGSGWIRTAATYTNVLQTGLGGATVDETNTDFSDSATPNPLTDADIASEVDGGLVVGVCVCGAGDTPPQWSWQSDMTEATDVKGTGSFADSYADRLSTTTGAVTCEATYASTSNRMAQAVVALAAAPVVAELTASPAGLGTASTPDLFRRVVVASDGSPAGTSNTNVFLSTEPPVELVASPAGVGSTTATLWRYRIQGFAGGPQGVAAASAVLFEPGARTVSASPVGAATTTVATFAVRSVGGISTAGVATTTSAVAAIRAAAATAVGVSTATISEIKVVRALAVAPAGSGFTEVRFTGVRIAELRALADGVGLATLELFRQAQRSTAADGTSSVTLGFVRRLNVVAGSDGVATSTVDLARQAHRDLGADGTATTAISGMAVVRAFDIAAAGVGGTISEFAAAAEASSTAGKYSAEHAQAYADVSAIEGTLTDDHAAALADVLEVGV